MKDTADISYRHIDTAQAYGNEREGGEGIRTCGVNREEMFVTAEIKTYKEAVASIDGSLKTLGLEYIDLMIIHSLETWANSLERSLTLSETGKHGKRLKESIMHLFVINQYDFIFAE